MVLVLLVMVYFKDYVRNQVDCLHFWDPTLTYESAIPACRNIQDLRVYRNISTHLATLAIEDVVDETECQVPCTYMKYTLANEMPPFYDRYIKNTNLHLIQVKEKITSLYLTYFWQQ